MAPSFVVDGDLTVIAASRRHHNFKVLSRKGPSFLLKQGVGLERSEAIRHEARVYQTLLGPDGDRDFDRYLPRFYGYDESKNLLILEFVPEADDLRNRHYRLGRFPSGPAAALGRALALLHRLKPSPPDGDRENRAESTRIPWIFFIGRPEMEMFHRMSHANRQLVRIIQKFPEVSDRLHALRRDWRPEAFIHSDLRWDNCVVARGSVFKLVDWELATVGDSCWDLGSVFADYVSAWILSIPITYDRDPERFPRLARYPLETMHPAMGAFWKAYVARSGMADRTARECLSRAARFAAVRLLQTAFEHLQTSSQLSGSLIYLLQLSLNILRRPRKAVVHLLGIAG